MDRTKAGALRLAVAAVAAATACSKPQVLSVGSKNFTESVILGELAAQHLERRLGRKVERKLSLGGTMLAHQSLLSRQIDVYPEYSGTALTTILRLDPESDPPEVIFERVRAGYRNHFQCEWMDPLGFDNSFVMVVRSEDAKANRLKTLSDAEALEQGFLLGAGYEFQERPDGYPALMKAYAKLRWRAPPKIMDLGLLYPALERRLVSMAAANATDAMLSKMDVRILTDDRRAFPPYQAAYVVRADSLQTFPGLKAALAELSGKIPARRMQKLNYAVDVEQKPVREVAASFLAEIGLR